MTPGSQLMIALRILATHPGLPATLTLTTDSKLSFYCVSDQVLYMESDVFPFRMLDAQGMGWVSSQLKSAASGAQKVQLFQAVTGSRELMIALKQEARKIASAYLNVEIADCKLRSDALPDAPELFMLSEVFYRTWKNWKISPARELLANSTIPFRLSDQYMARNARTMVGAQEGYLLSRLDRPMTISEIIASVPGDEDTHRNSLVRLWTFGLIDSTVLDTMIPKLQVPQRAQKKAEEKRPPGEETLEQLIGHVEETYRTISKKDFYGLLGIAPHAPLPEIKAAYYKLARKFHPDRFYSVTDPVVKEKVDIIFSTVNVAYETLKSVSSREEYDKVPLEQRGIKTSLVTETPTSTPGTDTLQKIAEQHARDAQKCYEEGNYYQAVQYLRSATQICPDVPRYWRQLGIALSRNAQWRKEAEDSFNRAIELDPKNHENYLNLGFLYKNTGLKLRARKYFQSALELDPTNEIALRELRETQPEEAKPQPKSSLFKKK